MWGVYYPAVVPLEDLPTWEEPWRPRLGGQGWPLETLMSRCIVSMAINAQPARSIDEDVLCVYSINIWSKSLVPGVVHYVSQIAMNSLRKVPGVVHLSRIHSMELPNNCFSVLWIWWFVLFFNSFLLGGIVGKFDNKRKKLKKNIKNKLWPWSSNPRPIVESQVLYQLGYNALCIWCIIKCVKALHQAS